MSGVTFIEQAFVATHRHHTGGLVQVLGIASPMSFPQNRQVVYMNERRDLYLCKLEEFVSHLPDGKRRRFYPMNPMFDLLSMVSVPPIKGHIKDFDKDSSKHAEPKS